MRFLLRCAVAKLLNRTRELARLEQSWKRAGAGSPELVLVWGRRRVGKTFLLSHFVRGRRAVYFGATAQAEAVELGRLHEAVRQGLGERAADLAGGGFTSWEAALKYLAALARDEPLALVLDEVPYLMQSTPGFASIVQVVWDHLADTRLMLVLTGSAVSVIEGIIGEGGALRGRPTVALRLEPLDPVDARVFLPRLSASDYLDAYAACGGYPLHLKAWDASESAEQNLKRMAFSAGGVLLDDASSMLAEELSGSAGYARILAAVGRGSGKHSEISSQAGQRIDQPLETLLRGGFLRRSNPVGAPKAAKPIYELADPYLAFWFSCLFAARSEIEGGQGPAVWRRIQPAWRRHLGAVFEELARDHARRLSAMGVLPPDLLIGRWWAATGEPCEVDVLGLRGAEVALIGEARLQDKPLDVADLHALKSKTSRVPRLAQAPVFAMWSRAGVSAAAKRAGAQGYELSEMLRPG
jgi:AAA+ ATPase superfamily predicted ATPase